MSDLCAVLLQVFDSESDSFWCFIEFLENYYGAIYPTNENMDHITVLKIWEACWSDEYCPLGYFKLFLALSIIYCYHEATEDGQTVFKLSTDEVLFFFSQSQNYDCDAILKCSQILLKAFRKSKSIPCSLSCLINGNMSGGWEALLKPKVTSL
ncbi:TBC1 domain family member 16 [Thelohanellus kitauei]|uniref:TBC1 domain family member 16 n=1 Tax=Thelohanellus kitauei TaxID=669202 RepID=A0A0C2MM85_THEKT|nr:TBC1 domain family member 16 [Thelohanellus kitauei]